MHNHLNNQNMKTNLISGLFHEKTNFPVMAAAVAILPLQQVLDQINSAFQGDQDYEYQQHGHTHILAIPDTSDLDEKFREAIFAAYSLNDLDIQEYHWSYQETHSGNYNLYIITIHAFLG